MIGHHHQLVVRLVFAVLTAGTTADRVVVDPSYSRWTDEADLLTGVKRSINREIARNVILFIGDGMGPNTVTAARIYLSGETGHLAWEKFPHMGAIKTYSADKQIPESATTATSMFTGVKNNFEMLGLDAEVKINDCEGSLKKWHRLKSIASHAQDAGKMTGIVTTTRVTDATPAAMYSWSANRTWECDSALPENAKKCKDIARQLIEDVPGKYFNVIMGGGAQVLRANATSTPGSNVDEGCCKRTDGRDLIAEWIKEKSSNCLKYAFVNDTESLQAADVKTIDYLLGIFSNSHMAYEYERDKSENGQPSLQQMTTTAILQLAKYPSGFLLMVEGGLIDKGHHSGRARVAIQEVLSLHYAVKETMVLLEKIGIKEETLVIVTSDHAHTLSMSGYPDRGNNIFGIADKSLYDGMPYTTLSYATSLKDNFKFSVIEGKIVREDPSTVDTTSYDYHIIAPVITDINTHGGSDVHVYASGPQAHLFYNLHENTYIATVIKYAARLGEYRKQHIAYSSTSCLLVSLDLLITAILLFFLQTTI